MLKASAATVHRARRLRKKMSLPEILLWRELRRRPGGFKFRNQHPAGAYVLDFFCAATNLCIEVDGESHDRADQAAFDAGRSEWLGLHGIEIVRIPAADILRDLDAAVTYVAETCRAKSARNKESP